VGPIILLAFGAAVFPTLLACVAIMISRPEPRRLLLAFYAGGLLTSVASGIVVLALFANGSDVLGSTTSTPHPATSIIAGVLALVLAWLLASTRGRSRIDRWRRSHPRRAAKPKEHKGPSWAERHLGEASAKVAFGVGATINLPGPFYLLALGDMATGGYSTGQQLGLILLFNAIMFLLLEAPLVGYFVRPEATAERVGNLSRWLNANGLRVTGWLVGVFATSLLAQGLTALAR
jgi:hypothetical protein